MRRPSLAERGALGTLPRHCMFSMTVQVKRDSTVPAFFNLNSFNPLRPVEGILDLKRSQVPSHETAEISNLSPSDRSTADTTGRPPRKTTVYSLSQSSLSQGAQ